MHGRTNCHHLPPTAPRPVHPKDKQSATIFFHHNVHPERLSLSLSLCTAQAHAKGEGKSSGQALSKGDGKGISWGPKMAGDVHVRSPWPSCSPGLVFRVCARVYGIVFFGRISRVGDMGAGF